MPDANAKNSRNALFVIVVFILGVAVVPGVIWVWPTPYYQPLRFSFDDVGVNLGITFQSDGPFAPANPISAYAVLLQAFLLPWNVTSFSVSIYPGNASLGNPIVIGPVPIHFYAVNPRNLTSPWNFYSDFAANTARGRLTFYAAGDQRLLVQLNLTEEGGRSYIDNPNTRINGTLTFPTYTLTISGSDAQYSLLALKVLALSIIVGGMLTGYFPTVNEFGKRWMRLGLVQRFEFVLFTSGAISLLLIATLPAAFDSANLFLLVGAVRVANWLTADVLAAAFLVTVMWFELRRGRLKAISEEWQRKQKQL